MEDQKVHQHEAAFCHNVQYHGIRPPSFLSSHFVSNTRQNFIKYCPYPIEALVFVENIPWLWKRALKQISNDASHQPESDDDPHGQIHPAMCSVRRELIDKYR